MMSTCRREQDAADSREASRGKPPAAGEIAPRRLVKIKGGETCLYEASGRWFVETKA